MFWSLGFERFGDLSCFQGWNLVRCYLWNDCFLFFFPFSSIFAFVRTTLHSGFFCQSAGDSMTGTCGYPEKKRQLWGRVFHRIEGGEQSCRISIGTSEEQVTVERDTSIAPPQRISSGIPSRNRLGNSNHSCYRLCTTISSPDSYGKSNLTCGLCCGFSLIFPYIFPKRNFISLGYILCRLVSFYLHL